MMTRTLIWLATAASVACTALVSPREADARAVPPPAPQRVRLCVLDYESRVPNKPRLGRQIADVVSIHLGLERSFVLLADSNACAAGHSPKAIAAAREKLEWTLLSLARQFRFPLEVLSANTLARPLQAHLLMDRIQAPNAYVAQQVAQMQFMRLAGAGVKIGWAVRGFHNDERRFDYLHDRSFSSRLAYVYTRGGRSLNASRPRCSPYVCESRADRLLLEPGECIAAKLDRFGRDRRHPLVRGYRRLLGHLARAHRQLVGPDRPWLPEARIQSVVDRLS